MLINFSLRNTTSLISSLLQEQKTGVLSVKILDNKKDGFTQPTNNSLNKDKHSISQIKNSNILTTKYFYFYSGRITYAHEKNNDNLARLKDYLLYYRQDSQITRYLASYQTKKQILTKEYDCLIWLLQNNYLTPQQLKKILFKLIKETIFELFICQQSTAKFQNNYSLNPICYSTVNVKTIGQIKEAATQWKKLDPVIISPNQYFYPEDKNYLKQNVSNVNYQYITHWSDEQKTFMQLSRQLNCSIIDIGKTFYPYIKKKLITF